MDGNLEMPLRVARLPADSAGWPVPWFVWRKDGELDFRCLCWICGEKMGVYCAFVLGPICAVNRVSREPPSHRECAEYNARLRPFRTTPKMHRRTRGLSEECHELGGMPIQRNAGVTLLWVTRSYWPVGDGEGKAIFRIGPPEPGGILFFRKGRRASRAEVLESIETGMPMLRDVAGQDGPEALKALEKSYLKALDLVFEAIPEEVAA